MPLLAETFAIVPAAVPVVVAAKALVVDAANVVTEGDAKDYACHTG